MGSLIWACGGSGATTDPEGDGESKDRKAVLDAFG